MLDRSTLQTAALTALSVLVFRALPVAGWVISASGASWLIRVCSIALLLGGVTAISALGVDPLQFAARAVGAFSFVALAAVILYALAPAFAAGRITRAGVISLCVLVFLVAPSLVFSGPTLSAMLVLGWDAALRMASFCLGANSFRTKGMLRSCVSFVVVGPHLVYGAARHARMPSVTRTGLQRIALGVTVSGGSILLFSVSQRVWAIYQTHDLARTFGTHTLVLLGLYAAHAGLASIQIGLMDCAGWELQERYNYPFLAVGPGDFWRRWNTWIGEWVRRYLYRPLIVKGNEYSGRTGRSLVVAASAISLFIIGVLHDLTSFLDRVDQPVVVLHAGFAMLFAMFGALALLTSLTPPSVKRRLARWRRTLVGRSVSIVLWNVVLFAMTYFIWPHVRGLGGTGV